MDDKYLLWIDLETTGLNPQKDIILEAAYCLTDLCMEPMNVKDNKVITCKRETVLDVIDDRVLQMHFESGLLPQAWSGSSLPFHEFFNRLDRNLRQTIRKRTSTVYFAGSSVWFDIQFVPPFVKNLDIISHRFLDVSTYKVAFPDIFEQDNSGGHRAEADMRWSMEQHKKMIDLLNK